MYPEEVNFEVRERDGKWELVMSIEPSSLTIITGYVVHTWDAQPTKKEAVDAMRIAATAMKVFDTCRPKTNYNGHFNYKDKFYLCDA